MRIIVAIAAIVICLSAPAVARAQDQAQCEANFKEKGNFLTGTSFSTFQDFPAAADEVFRSALFAIASDGFQITSQDSELRMISAAQTVTAGDGSTAPLNVMIEEHAQGSRARVSFTVAGWQLAVDPRRHICELVRRFGEQ